MGEGKQGRGAGPPPQTPAWTPSLAPFPVLPSQGHVGNAAILLGRQWTELCPGDLAPASLSPSPAPRQ